MDKKESHIDSATVIIFGFWALFSFAIILIELALVLFASYLAAALFFSIVGTILFAYAFYQNHKSPICDNSFHIIGRLIAYGMLSCAGLLMSGVLVWQVLMH